MASFESLVRPFTNVSISPTAGVTSVPTPANNAVLTVIGTGQVKSGNYSYSFDLQCYVDAKQKEQTQAGG